MRRATASTSLSVLHCARRCLHEQPQPPAGAAPPASPAIKLRRALWMRMHPVERWTSLVDLGRRGAYLIEKPVPQVSSASASTTSTLGSADEKVNFSASATAAHQRVCAALPYAARLHLCLSLLMWIRSLRDVQDTLARVRLPYAVVRRPHSYAVADVYPTRLSEYWVDVHSTVSAKMNAQRNSTAEQVPAPHTWNVETAETIEDAATESTITIDAGRVLHGRRHARLTGRALLRQVQAVQPRASADDDVAARLSDKSSDGARRRRRHRRLTSRGGNAEGGGVLPGPSSLSVESAAAEPTKRREASLEFQSDALRRVPAVSLEAQPAEDARYHGNTDRGEGCPLNEDGESTPAPVYIHVPPQQPRSSTEATANAVADGVEALMRHCVMAHAAILSCLYIEGRVVDFSTNDATVAAYVRWLLEDLVMSNYVSVTEVDAQAAARLRPYYPAWCWRSVLVLIPPKAEGRQGSKSRTGCAYSTAQLRDWAARIAQAAPCAVMVEGGEAALTGYVARLKEEVARVQNNERSGTTTTTTSPLPERRVDWVPIVSRDHTIDAPANNDSADAPPPSSTSEKASGAAASADTEESTGAFRPQRAGAAATPAVVPATLNVLQSVLMLMKGSGEDGSSSTSSASYETRQQRFLDAVQETLQDRFYMCEFLYSPVQSCLTPYRFERWLYERLPANVRVVGVNTAPLDVLFYFPQGVFLTQKVGNALRYRAVERTIVAKDLVPSWSSHPLRFAATKLKRWSRWWRRRGAGSEVGSGLHAELSLTDRRTLQRGDGAVQTGDEQRSAPPSKFVEEESSDEVASHALVRERTVEYLAEPSKWSLLGLAVARFFKV